MINFILKYARILLTKGSFGYQIATKIYLLPKLLFTKYGYIYNYMILPIVGYLKENHIKPFYDDNSKILERLRDKHAGKRCFVIATGPSLRLADVEKLKDEITIGVNSLYKIFDKTDFRPTYYMVLDPDVQKIVEAHFEDYSSFYREEMFFNPIMKSSNKKVRYISVCYQDHWYNWGNPNYNYSKPLKYSTNIVKFIYDKYTITNAAIDLAIYMGCNEIYLIGVDCNYTGPQLHFDSAEGESEAVREKGYYLQKAMMCGYKFMESETKKRGIHVFNATRGGMLEEFDRVDFDTLF